MAEARGTSEAAGRLLPYSASPSFDYIPALDGLRAASVAMVVASHAGLKHAVPGGFGVTVFFFVSGFLITRQVLAEQDMAGRISLPRFFMRRVLRLYPALLVMLAVGGGLFVALGGTLTGGQVLAGVFYYTNIEVRFSSYGSVPDGMYSPFAILWSLAVEEHYYLVFPVLVVLLGRTRLRFALVLCAAIAAVTAWRFHLAGVCSAGGACLGEGGDDRILQGTDTRIDSILYGAVLATVLGTRLGAPLLRLVRNGLAFGVGLAMILASFVIRDPFFRDTARYSVQGIGLFLAVGGVLFSNRLGLVRAVLSWRAAVLLGRWSYSLYLWHSIVLMCAASVLPPGVWRPALVDGHMEAVWGLVCLPLVVAASLGVAGLSYTYVEMPMVTLRRRFGSHARRGLAGQSLPSSHPAAAAAMAASTNGAPAKRTEKMFSVKA